MNVTLIESYTGLGKLTEFFQKVKTQKIPQLGFDVETTVVKDFYFRRCRTQQFGDAEEQYVIDLLPFADNDPDLLHSMQGKYGAALTPKMLELQDALEPVLCSRDYLKVGVSLGFEYQTMYWLFGKRTFNFYDCGMAEKAIWAGAHSLKHYAFYSMNSMMERYMGLTIDKDYQESFNLTDKLIPGQINYAAFDTRSPLALKAIQSAVLAGKKLRDINPTQQKFYMHLEPKIQGTGEPVIMGDNLKEVVSIENDAIGAFEDMHIHGELLDRKKWLARVQKSKDELRDLIDNLLDPFFLPIVGDKTEISTDAQLLEAENIWKEYNNVTAEELALKKQIRDAKKAGKEDLAAMLDLNRAQLESKRKADKEIYKTAHSDMKKKRTKVKNLAKKCEGKALINYGSDKQLLAVIQTMKGLGSVKSLDDEVLEKYADKGYAIMAAIRQYHGLGKEIGTYGDQWAMEWATKPCKEEGWLNPGDGRLHCVYNQYDAETGRSSSEKPNGQNLPQDEEVRSCFIADPPDGTGDEQVLVTCDMSGAELRIIAELANDPIWIGAFDRGEDVHSVCTEVLYPDKWPELALPGCAYYKLKEDGTPQRFKCKCPEHNALRNETKSCNFLLAYGGTAGTLSKRIKKSVEVCEQLMAIHEAKFPRIWKYLEKSGKDALMLGRSFDMFGRRRLFPEPTWALAKERCKEDKEKKLRLDEDEALAKVELFIASNMRKPDEDELYDLTHREPYPNEIGHTMHGMKGGVERQGKNHRIQGSNASIAKISMGSGFDHDGVPFLWHTLPKYNARLVKFVHDELVISSPKIHAAKVAAEIQSAFLRAAAMRMTKVKMKSEFNIAGHWSK
jgi:DNA polymerase I-like protein with 3'-5' exonuclease and polymerase domains